MVTKSIIMIIWGGYLFLGNSIKTQSIVCPEVQLYEYSSISQSSLINSSKKYIMEQSIN